MMIKPLPSATRLRELLKYDSESGKLIWAKRDIRQARNVAGAEAGYLSTSHGYRMVGVDGNEYLAHRIILKMTQDDFDETLCVDHIDGCRDNNARRNLRSVSISGNLQNKRMQSNNTSGVVGVSVDKRSGRYVARIKIAGGAYKHLGTFSSVSEAAKARRAAEVPIHGATAARLGVLSGVYE